MSGAMKLPTAEEILANCRVIERETANLAKIAHEAVSDNAKLRDIAQRLAGTVAAVLPMLRTIQQFCKPGDHDETIALAEHNLAEARAAGLLSVPLEGK